MMEEYEFANAILEQLLKHFERLIHFPLLIKDSKVRTYIFVLFVESIAHIKSFNALRVQIDEALLPGEPGQPLDWKELLENRTPAITEGFSGVPTWISQAIPSEGVAILGELEALHDEITSYFDTVSLDSSAQNLRCW